MTHLSDVQVIQSHVTPISKSLGYPPWLSYHTSERHCVVLQKNFMLQSWHNYTREKNNHTWAFGGFPFPHWVSFHDGGVENQLWKAWAALGPINIMNLQGTFHDNMTMRACLTGNHAFMWGRAQNVNVTAVDSGEYNVTCINCRVFECIGTKIRDQIIFVITQQKFALVPVKSKDWYESRSDHIFGIIDQSNQLAVARKKRCISCVVLGIVSLIAIITASVSLSQSISITRNEMVQADFMNQLAHNVSKGFQTQKRIDDEFYHILEGMKETIIEIGDELDILEYRTHLKCDYRYEFICLTNVKYNKSQWDWQRIRRHLNGLFGNSAIAVDIDDLYEIAKDIARAADKDLMPDKTAQRILDWIDKLRNPFDDLGHWFMSLLSSLLPLCLILLAMLCFGPCLLRCIADQIKDFGTELHMLRLHQKQKGGVVGDL
ncbi:endogenous retrovirus group K member 7 Env polyprotein-like [Phascolarctos cinereus]